MREHIATALTYLRDHGAGIAVEVVVNFAAPFLIYDLTKHRLGDVGALIASSGPPIAWSLIELVRKRRLDAVSMLVIAGIALSLLAMAGGGSAKFLQLREKLVTGLIGLVFLGSAAIGRPLIYQLARASIRRQSPDQLEQFESRRQDAGFKRTMMIMTLVWGFGLLAEMGVGVMLVLTLSIHDYLLASPVVGYGTMGALFAWTFWFVRRRRRQAAVRMAAAAVSAEHTPPAVA